MSASASRIEALRRQIRRSKADCIYVSALPNIRYLTGFRGSAGALLVTPDQAVLFVDGRYRTQAAEQTEGIEVVVSERGAEHGLLADLTRRRIRKLGFERNRLSYAAWETLRAPRRELIGIEGAVERLRAVKDADEIEAIARSCALNAEAYERTLRRARPSWTEARLAAELDHTMRLLGAEGPAFDSIVASGAHSALPHAQPRRRRLVRDGLIVLDHGAILDGYASDMTRVAAFGAPDVELRRIVKAVREAQAAALDVVKAGAEARTVDRAARQALKQHGLDQYFSHSTGHGLGLEIHEQPRIGPRERMRLREGMTITIEPGVYVEGLGGARIEDTVVVTSTGCRILTPPSKALRILK